MDDKAELATLLERLLASDIEFVLVGGLAAVVQGAPVTTFDVDIVHHRTEVNVDRLLALLTSLDAHYRNRPGQRLPPSRNALLGPGHSLFMTNLGPLDALGTIEGGADYDSLFPESLSVPISNRTAHVLSLSKLVSLKRASTDPKDKLRLPILEATLRRRP